MASYICACPWACAYGQRSCGFVSAFNPRSAAGECSWCRARRAAAALPSPSKSSRYFSQCQVISCLTDSPEILWEPLYQIFPNYCNPSKIPSSPGPLHLLVPYHLPHFLSVPSPWLRQLLNPTSKPSKSCS